jgi:F-type H+-transporting ATPase subunit a
MMKKKAVNPMDEQAVSFEIQNLGVLRFGSIEIWITETHLATWIIMGILITFALVVRFNLKKFKDIPKGLQNVTETMVEFFDKFVRDSAGEKQMFLGNWYFMAFAFLLLSNIGGLLYLRNPTADWTMTFAFALITFIFIQIMSIRSRGGKYLLSLVNPLNLIGELARPVSLSFRLFGNILAGMILMTLLYTMAPVFLRFLVPIPLHFYFDLFAGVLQAYVFCILSLSFIGVAATNE